MKQFIIDTPFVKCKITYVENNTLSFDFVGFETFKIMSSPSFTQGMTNHLHAFAKTHNHKFPSLVQLEVIDYLMRNGLLDWLHNEKIDFSYGFSTYITDEVLQATISNPYGKDIVVKRFVCYNTNDSIVRVLEEKLVRYMLLVK
jgi:hypothetical protein